MKIVLVGHTVGIRRCIEACQGSSHSIVAVFTHPRSEHTADLALFEKRKDIFGDLAYNVFDTPAQFGIPVEEYPNLSDDSEIHRVKAYAPDMIVTVGCREILSANFIAAFPKVINLHPFYLPVFRGAGIDSWMILQGASGTEQYATAHFVRPKLDAGEIITTLPYRIPEEALPIDIFRVRINLLGELLKRALTALENPSFTGEIQNEQISRYYPRLNTMLNGHIRIREWTGSEIELFIRAFSYPYPGSFAFLAGSRVHLLRSKFESEENVHPYSIGLIYRKSAGAFSFFVRGGSIHVSEFELENPETKIRLGHYLL